MNKVPYDGVGDTLSIVLSKKQIAYAEEHGAVIVNYDDKGKACRNRNTKCQQIYERPPIHHY
jgi:hypothetical protein